MSSRHLSLDRGEQVQALSWEGLVYWRISLQYGECFDRFEYARDLIYAYYLSLCRMLMPAKALLHQPHLNRRLSSS